MPTMFEQAITHIRAGEIEKARPFLIDWLKQNPNDENAWLWMTKCVPEPEQRRYCFEKVLKINPQNQYAIRGLRHLDKPVSQPVSQPISAPAQSPNSPLTQKKVNAPQPVQKVRTQGPFEVVMTVVTVGIGIFLVLLCIYAWWVAR